MGMHVTTNSDLGGLTSQGEAIVGSALGETPLLQELQASGLSCPRVEQIISQALQPGVPVTKGEDCWPSVTGSKYPCTLPCSVRLS